LAHKGNFSIVLPRKRKALPNTRDDFYDECRVQFQEDLAYATAQEEWSQREMAAALTVSMVYVTDGGMDVWLEVSLESDFKIDNENISLCQRVDTVRSEPILSSPVKSESPSVDQPTPK